MLHAPSLECVRCGQSFTLDDVLRYEFFFESGLCYECCRSFFRLPEDINCFGKLYDPVNPSCKRFCPDRKVCPLFMTKEIKALRKEALTEVQRKGALQLLRTQDSKTRARKHPFQSGSLIYKAFELCRTNKGIDQTELRQFITKQDADYARVIRILRRGELYGKTWEWKESNSRYKIIFAD